MDATYLPAPHHLLRLAVSSLNDAFSTLKSFTGPEHARPRSNAEFEIYTETGFVPKSPLQRLPSSFDFWERALERAHQDISLGEDDTDAAVAKRASGERWRENVRKGPLISIQSLVHDMRKLQRAHLVLAWLVQFYVHSIPPSQSQSPTIVPKTLAIPLVAVSKILGIAPILTYADTVLWNAAPKNPDFPISADNMKFQHLFSGTDDEEAFYTTSAAVELRGAEILQIIEEYHRLPNLTEITTVAKVANDLRRVAAIIAEMSDIVQSVRASCDPHVFYWAIRPWYKGADADGPSSPGWIYEGIENTNRLDLSGPSAGQTPVMHGLDIWLDIDHKLKQRRSPAPSEDNKKADHGFMERMRRYMPATHQEYLRYVETSPRPIRDLARQVPALREPFNAAVSALKKMRDAHIRVACLYVVTMSKSTPGSRKACPMIAMMERAKREESSSTKAPVRGTGGNELSTLLKAGRDATQRALIN